MQEQDVVSIEYLENTERFADLLNGYVFAGKQVIKPQDIQERNRVITKRRAQKLESKVVIRDVMRKVFFGMNVVVISLENQTDIHYAMPVRVLSAEAVIYEKQWKERQEEHREKKDLKGAEFVSGFAKDDKLLPTFTIVVYFGSKPWDGPRSLKDMLNLSGLPEYIKDMIADYPMHLLEVRKYPHLEYFQTDLKYVFGFLQHATDKEALAEYVAENTEQFSNMNEEAYDMIACMSKSKELKLIKRKYQKEEGERVDMCQAIKDMIADGRDDGIRIGEKRGVKRGVKQGIELTKSIFKANAAGKSNQEIAREFNISVSKVKEILA